MRINVCVPTRGKPEYLRKFTDISLATSTLATTRFVIGIDQDDEAVRDLRPWHPKVIVCSDPREDSLGAKYNRCAEAHTADLYVMGLDDVAIATPGWDQKLSDIASQSDPQHVIYFGKEPHGEALPSMMAVSRGFIRIAGFCPPMFPFWWNNTWIDEIAQFAGCVVRADEIVTQYPDLNDFPVPPRRDIGYWAKLFDDTRTFRLGAAQRLVAARFDHLRGYFLRRNTCLTDPKFTAAIQSLPDPDDARHARLKAQAEFLRKAL